MNDKATDLKARLQKAKERTRYPEQGDLRSELVEAVSFEAEQLAASRKGPTELITALIAIDAVQYVAMAAERYSHAATERLKESTDKNLASSSPVFLFEKKTVIAASTASLSKEGLTVFFDRILATVLKHKVRKVVLALGGTAEDDAENRRQIRLLKEDLADQNITLIVK